MKEKMAVTDDFILTYLGHRSLRLQDEQPTNGLRSTKSRLPELLQCGITTAGTKA